MNIKNIGKKILLMLLSVSLLTGSVSFTEFLPSASLTAEAASLAAPKNFKVEFNNLSAKLTWSKVTGASGYVIYRRFNDGKYTKIKMTTSLSYTETYHSGFTQSQRDAYLNHDYCLDVSSNPITYAIKAYKKSGSKYTYSSKVIYYDLCEPVITGYTASGKTITVSWGTVPFAKKYYIYTKASDDAKWEKVRGLFAETDKSIMTASFDNNKPKYVTVRAISTRNGVSIKSNYDPSFDVTGFASYKNKNILVIGDSISYGSPYRQKLGTSIYTYCNRIALMTGANVDNISISGGRVSTSSGTSKSIAKRVINMGTDSYENIKDTSGEAVLPLESYDVVIIGGGTNDYSDNVKMGTYQASGFIYFRGALNNMMDALLAASKRRVSNDKAPITVVYTDIFYGQKRASYAKVTNRYTTDNTIGFTLSDYNTSFVKVIESYAGSNLPVVRCRTTSFVNSANCSTATVENLHMTRITAAHFGDYIAGLVIEALK